MQIKPPFPLTARELIELLKVLQFQGKESLLVFAKPVEPLK